MGLKILKINYGTSSDVDRIRIYGRLPGSGSVWRDTDPDSGHINVQNNAMAEEFCVNKMINVDCFQLVLKHFFL